MERLKAESVGPDTNKIHPTTQPYASLRHGSVPTQADGPWELKLVGRKRAAGSPMWLPSMHWRI